MLDEEIGVGQAHEDELRDQQEKYFQRLASGDLRDSIFTSGASHICAAGPTGKPNKDTPMPFVCVAWIGDYFNYADKNIYSLYLIFPSNYRK